MKDQSTEIGSTISIFITVQQFDSQKNCKKFHFFYRKRKFLAILPQKLGVDLICICTCYITHRVSGYRVKDVLKWKNGQTNTNTIKVGKDCTSTS